jgi:hypothetical protein
MMSDLHSEGVLVNIPTDQVSAFVHCLRAEVERNPGWALTGRRDETNLTAHLYFHRRDPVPFTIHVPWRFQEGLTSVTVLVGRTDEQQAVGCGVDLAALAPDQLHGALGFARQLIQAAAERHRKAGLREYDITCPLLTDHGGRVSDRYRFGPFILIPEDPENVFRIGPEARLAFKVRAIDKEHAREVAHGQAIIGAAFLAVATRTRVVIRRGAGRGVSSQPVPHEPGTLDALWSRFPDGIILNVRRPELEPLATQGWLRVPQDIGELYDRYANLCGDLKKRFTNAMLAYQTALDLWGTYDTLAAVGFVTALNTLAPYVESARECPGCGRQERVPSHRQSIHQLITGHVPLHEAVEGQMLRFVDRTYGEARSGYVHRGELRGRELIGSYWGTHFVPGAEGFVPQAERFGDDIGALESITNAVLVNWVLRDGA